MRTERDPEGASVPRAETDAIPGHEFMAALAHEIRNPLTPILAAAAVLRSHCTDSKLALAVKTIERQVIQLTNLMDMLVEATALRQGALNLAQQRVDMGALTRQALEGVRPAIDLKRQNLEVTLAAPALQMRCDPQRIVQIIHQLLDHVSRYTPEGGAVTLRIELRDSQLHIETTDDGYGIDPELLPRLFNLFSASAPRLHRATSGLGVGLAIARNLVEIHGGTITAHSAGIGQGSQFRVRLPCQEITRETSVDPPRSSGDAVACTPGSDIRRARRVLLVEDRWAAATALASGLEERGYAVKAARDGKTAVELAAVFRPEVAIIDIGLPDFDGFEVARRLRQEPGTARALLIAASGYALQTFHELPEHAIFDHYMVKPIEPQGLAAAVEELLNIRAQVETA